MHRAALALFLAAAACGPKAPPAAPAAATEQPAGSVVTADIPDSPDAKAFAKKLIDNVITDFAVAEGTGGSVLWTELHHNGDGTWNATASFKAGGETFPCAESGKWELLEAESATVGTLDWRIGKTTCPTRDADHTTRVQVTLTKSGADIAFR